MKTKSLLFNQEPLWQPIRSGTRHKLPANIASWLYETGSLTQRLRSHFGNDVAVKVLLQTWEVPFLSERKRLHLPEHRYSLVREVMLHINGKPLIVARTIIPDSAIKTAKSNLSQLGTRPLGEVIFSYPDLERMGMDVTLTKISSWQTGIQQAIPITSPIWGRRTIYAIRHQQMLVSEFFLPDNYDS